MKFIGLCGKCYNSNVETKLVEGLSVCETCRNMPQD